MAGTVSHKIAKGLEGLAVDIESLQLDPNNARLHGERGIQSIAESLQRFGQRRPLVANRQSGGLVLEAGEGVLTAARSLGWTHVAVLVVQDSDTDATGYAITDNRTAELSYFDPVMLQELLMELHHMDQTAVIGWSPEDLEMMLSGSGEELASVPDPGSNAGNMTNPYEERRERAQEDGAVDGESKFRAYQLFIPVEKVAEFDEHCDLVAKHLGASTLADTIMLAVGRLAE